MAGGALPSMDLALSLADNSTKISTFNSGGTVSFPVQPAKASPVPWAWIGGGLLALGAFGAVIFAVKRGK